MTTAWKSQPLQPPYNLRLPLADADFVDNHIPSEQDSPTAILPNLAAAPIRTHAKSLPTPIDTTPLNSIPVPPSRSRPFPRFATSSLRLQDRYLPSYLHVTRRFRFGSRQESSPHRHQSSRACLAWLTASVRVKIAVSLCPYTRPLVTSDCDY